ncbi:RF-1 domain-containing protein [Melampsora americana]|nr:RF-1 domain-containing protein [Melampsora americana]
MKQSFKLILSSFNQTQIRSIQTTSTLFLPSKLPKIQKLNESDLVEEFVRGSGPGGQAINSLSLQNYFIDFSSLLYENKIQLSISVSLIHKPTGIRVQCHAQRSRESNRKEARKILNEKVDLFLNPGKSKLEFKWQKARNKKRAKVRQRKRRENDQDDQDEDENLSKSSLKEDKTEPVKAS